VGTNRETKLNGGEKDADVLSN
ncbi:MAG: hypothetical protein RIQ62_1332, partial [Bacteroidota bacterium]